MPEIVSSVFNKNSLLYGSGESKKNMGPDCVGGKSAETKKISVEPAPAPIKAVREK